MTIKNLTTGELMALRNKARAALFSGDYAQFGTYGNVEKALLGINGEIDRRKSSDNHISQQEAF